MKTNVSIELNDEQRLNLGQKYHNTKAKKMITRKELNHVVRKFIEQVEVQSNIPDEMGIEEFAKAIAKMTWEVSSE
jgi:shikimate kinase|tara:strand:+ start:675 stop:902 length:228 start_codon:yes stop_codon:yes gene_type:complete